MMNTTHLFNKATQRVANADGWAVRCEALGLDPMQLMAAIRERAMLTAAENNNLTGTDLAVTVSAIMFSIGVETGMLLCDPATHLAEH